MKDAGMETSSLPFGILVVDCLLHLKKKSSNNFKKFCELQTNLGFAQCVVTCNNKKEFRSGIRLQLTKINLFSSTFHFLQYLCVNVKCDGMMSEVNKSQVLSIFRGVNPWRRWRDYGE